MTIFYGERWSIAEGESVTDYSIELKAIAEHCVFGEFLDTALRDRFVAGLKSSKVKAKILNGAKDSKFDVIVQMAVSSELVDENFRVMGAPRSEIYLVRNNQEAHCSRYDRRNHSRSSSSGRSRSRNQDRKSLVRNETKNIVSLCYFCMTFSIKKKKPIASVILT
jgi:hypothetical protein